MRPNLILTLAVLSAAVLISASVSAPAPEAVKKNKAVTTINVTPPIQLTRVPSNGPTVGLSLANGGITGAHLANNSVTTNHLVDGTVELVDISDAAKAALQGAGGGSGETDGPGPGEVRTEVARRGMPAPGGGSFLGPKLITGNKTGHVLYLADLDTDGNLATTEATGLFLYGSGPGAHIQIMRTGDNLPDGRLCQGINGSSSNPNLLTDSGKVYFRAEGPSYVPGITVRLDGLYGFDAATSQIFTIIGQGVTSADGKLLTMGGQFSLVPNERVAFTASYFEPTGGASTTQGLLVYGTP